MTHNAIHAMFWGISGSFIVGILGFFIGGIVCHPKGNDNNKWPSFCKDLFTLSNPDETNPNEDTPPETDEVTEPENITEENRVESATNS